MFPSSSTFKPPVGTQIDFGHPLAQGLAHCWLFNEGAGSTSYNLATGGTSYNCPNIGVSGNGLTWSTTRYGVSVLQNTATPCSAGILPTLNGAASATLVVFGEWVSTSSLQIGGADFTTGNRIGISTSSGIMYMVVDNGSTIGNNTGTFASGNMAAFAFNGANASGSRVSGWVNGLPITVTANNQPTAVNSSGMPWHFSYATASNAKVAAVYLWINRALNSSDIDSLYVDPWSFLYRNKYSYHLLNFISTPVSIDLSAVSSNSIVGGASQELDALESAVTSSASVGGLTFDSSAVLYLQSLTSSASVGGLTFDSSAVLYLQSLTSSASVGGLTWPFVFSASSLEVDAILGGQTFSGSYTFSTVPYGWSLNPSHWANQKLSGWWEAPAGPGPVLPDMTGNHHMTVVPYSGSDSYPGGPWTFTSRPGAISQASVGPCSWGATPTHYFFDSGTSINTLCPTSGTISLWVLPIVPYGSISPGDQGLFFSGDFNVLPNFGIAISGGGSMYAGFYASATDYRASTGLSAVAFGGWNVGKWTHFVFTFAAGDYTRLYRDGRFASSSAVANSNPLPSGMKTNMILGGFLNSSSGAFVYGNNAVLMDDVSVWSYQMTGAQIAQVYRESGNGWINRLASWGPLDRFSPGPYFSGLAVNAPSVSASAVFGGFNLNFIYPFNSPGADAFYGTDAETITVRSQAQLTVCLPGGVSSNLDISFAALGTDAILGDFVPPGTAFIVLTSVESDAVSGSFEAQIDIDESAPGTTLDVGAAAGIWNTTYVDSSAVSSIVSISSIIAQNTTRVSGVASSGSPGVYLLYIGTMLPIIGVGSLVDVGASLFEIDIVHGMGAPKATATQGTRKSGPNPWLSALEADAAPGSFSALIKSNVHGVAITVRTGNAPFGPWVELVAPTAAAALGDVEESIVIRAPGRKVDAGAGTVRSAVGVPLVSVETDASQGAATWDFIRRTTALHASILLGSNPVAPVIDLGAVDSSGDAASQSETVTARVRAPQSQSSSARVRSTVGVEASAVTSDATASSVFNAAPSPVINSVQVSSTSGGKKAKVIVDSSAQSADADVGGTTPAVAPALHGLAALVGPGRTLRAVSADLEGLSADAVTGSDTESVVMRCIGFRTNAIPGSDVFYSDPVNLGLPGTLGTATLGGRHSIAAMVPKTPYAMGAMGRSKLAWSASLSGVTASAVIGSFTAGPVMRVWAVDSGVAVGLGLPSSPPLDLDIMGLRADVGVGETLAVVAAIIGAPEVMVIAGSAGSTLYLSMAGLQTIGTAGSSPPSIEPYAYPDPFQSTDTEEVDPFDSQSEPRH